MAPLTDLTLTAGFHINLADADQRLPLLQRLCSDEEDALLDGIRHLRIILKCSRQQKLQAIKLEIPKRLLGLLVDHKRLSSPLIAQILHAICSVGSHVPEAIDHLISLDAPSIVLDLLRMEDALIIEAAMRCLHILFHNTTASHRNRVMQILGRNPESLRRLIDLMDASPIACEIACDVMALSPSVAISSDSGSKFCFPVTALLEALTSPRQTVKRASLLFLVAQSQSVSLLPKFIHAFSPSRELLSKNILALLDPSEDVGIRVLALGLLTTLHKKDFALCDSQILSVKILPILARLCRKERPINIRISAAEIMANLIDDRPALQELASYNDQIMTSLAFYLKMPSMEKVIEMRKRNGEPMLSVMECGQELKRSAFLAFSALASSNEVIRKRVAEVEGLVEAAVACSTDKDSNVAYSALRLLHSLSRSIQQLRTIFKEHNVWETALLLLRKPNTPNALAILASAIIANLSLEFSSCHADLIKKNIWTTMATLLSRPDEKVLENVVWTFMNLTYMASPEVKKTVEEVLSVNNVEFLLQHQNQQIVTCTVGMIRNLLHTTPPKEVVRPVLPNRDVAARILRRMRGHAFSTSLSLESSLPKCADVMESLYCQELLTRLLRLLKDATDSVVLEQSFCALVNVCCSCCGRQLILSNTETMELIRKGLLHIDLSVAISAVLCVSNLAAPSEENGQEEDGRYFSCLERQRRLIDMNFMRELTRLLTTEDRHLFERVKGVIHHLNGSS